jgi:hypothetical protein
MFESITGWFSDLFGGGDSGGGGAGSSWTSAAHDDGGGSWWGDDETAIHSAVRSSGNGAALRNAYNAEHGQSGFLGSILSGAMAGAAEGGWEEVAAPKKAKAKSRSKVKSPSKEQKTVDMIHKRLESGGPFAGIAD